MIGATNAVKTNDNNHGLCAQAALPPLYLLSPAGCTKKNIYTKKQLLYTLQWSAIRMCVAVTPDIGWLFFLCVCVRVDF